MMKTALCGLKIVCLVTSKNLRRTINFYDGNIMMKIFVNVLFGAAVCMVRLNRVKKKHASNWFDVKCAQKKKAIKRGFKG